MSNNFKSFLNGYTDFLGDVCASDINDLRFDHGPSCDWYDGARGLKGAALEMADTLKIQSALHAFVAIDTALDEMDVATMDAYPALFEVKAEAEDVAYRAIEQAFELALAKHLVQALFDARWEAYEMTQRFLNEAGYEG